VSSTYSSKATVDGFSEANLVKAKYSWDEDKDRVKTLQRFADYETAKDDPLLNVSFFDIANFFFYYLYMPY